MAAKSIEEQVEDLAKEQLKKFGVRYFTKNESLNEEIDGALKKADSKSGGARRKFSGYQSLFGDAALQLYSRGD